MIKAYAVCEDKFGISAVYPTKETALNELALFTDKEDIIIKEWETEGLYPLDIDKVAYKLSDEEKRELAKRIESGFFSWLFENPKYMKYFGYSHSAKRYDLTVYRNTLKLKGKRKEE